MKVKKKPETFDAIQWTGRNREEIEELSRKSGLRVSAVIEGTPVELAIDKQRVFGVPPINLNIGDWLVYERQTGLMALSNDEFLEKFEEQK